MIKVKDLYKVIDGEVVLDHLNMQMKMRNWNDSMKYLKE